MQTKSIPELTPKQIERFWSYVEVPYQPSCCWEWNGMTSGGYGRFYVYIDGKDRYRVAHRIAYTLLIGPIPDEMVLDHLCRNHRCVNPDHLEVVTNHTNILRGYASTAINARKTYCIHGHEYTPENTKSRPDRPGRRDCRECNRVWDKRRRARKAQERMMTAPKTDQINERIERINGPVHTAFGLTYASYLVLPRSLMQEMPLDWQERFSTLMDEYWETWDSAKADGDYNVHLRDERGRYRPDPLANYRRPSLDLIDDMRKKP